MIRSDIDKTGIASDVVNAIGIRTRNVRTGKIVTLNLFGLLCRKPLLACVVVVANELFFLVSTDITGFPRPRYLFTSRLICRN
jgi:hypothetical protein